MKNKNKKKFIHKVQMSIQQEKGIRFHNMLLKSFNMFTLTENKHGILAEKYKRKHNMCESVWFERSLNFTMGFINHNKN